MENTHLNLNVSPSSAALPGLISKMPLKGYGWPPYANSVCTRMQNTGWFHEWNNKATVITQRQVINHWLNVLKSSGLANYSPVCPAFTTAWWKTVLNSRGTACCIENYTVSMEAFGLEFIQFSNTQCFFSQMWMQVYCCTYIIQNNFINNMLMSDGFQCYHMKARMYI